MSLNLQGHLPIQKKQQKTKQNKKPHPRPYRLLLLPIVILYLICCVNHLCDSGVKTMRMDVKKYAVLAYGK